METDPSYLAVMLNSDDLQILKAIQYGLRDTQSIHLLTGVPLPCIERRMHAYLGFSIIIETIDGYMLNESNESSFYLPKI
jgi:hypothetical protein